MSASPVSIQLASIAKETPIIVDVSKHCIDSYADKFKGLIRVEKAVLPSSVAKVANDTLEQLQRACAYYYQDASGELYLSATKDKLLLTAVQLLKIFDLVFFFEAHAPKALSTTGCYAQIADKGCFLFKKVKEGVRIVQIRNYKNTVVSGGESDVYKVLEVTKGIFRVLKTPKANCCIECFNYGVSVMSLVHKTHRLPGIARMLFTTSINVESPTLVMPLYEGTLDMFVEEIAKNFRFKMACVDELINSIHQLHQKKMAHRDIKMANILVKRIVWGKETVGFKYSLTDFGNAICKELTIHHHLEKCELPTPKTYTSSDLIGCTEHLKGDALDARILLCQKQDVYALGLILNEVIGDWGLIEMMLQNSPEARPSMHEIFTIWSRHMKRGPGPSVHEDRLNEANEKSESGSDNDQKGSKPFKK